MRKSMQRILTASRGVRRAESTLSRAMADFIAGRSGTKGDVMRLSALLVRRRARLQKIRTGARVAR